MRRQNNFPPKSQSCCCPCNGHQTEPQQADRNDEYRDENGRFYGGRRSSAEATYCNAVKHTDEETRQTITSMRQKACKFITEETECSSDSDSGGGQCTCQSRNTEKEGSLLQRAQNSIDYVPQSEFLKKIKRQLQCQCLSNNDRRGSLVDSNSFIPRICEECIAKSNEIIRLLEQLNNHGLTTTDEYEDQCRACHCDQEPEPDRNGIKRIVKTCRSVVDGLKSVLTSMGPYMNGECYNDNDNCHHGSGGEFQNIRGNASTHGMRLTKSQKNKSQHVSRPKKRVNCRERRKRKSNESDKCVSQDRFEPSLKKPHENSCERCWRYASPSRSPVNKPAQRFDPNFRRAHSFHDFLSTEGGESVVNRSTIGSPERILPTANRKPTDLTRCRPQEFDPASTQVKELMWENCNSPFLQNKIHKERTANDDFALRDTYEGKPRPKSCTQGVSTSVKGPSVNECRRSKMPCPSRNGNTRPLRSDRSPNSSSYLGEKNPSNYAKPKTLEYPTKTMSSRKCAPDPYNSNNQKNNSNKPCRKAPTSASTNPSHCRECTCNKTQTPRADSSRYSPQQISNKSPRREKLASPVRTQSSVLLESRTPSEKRPRTSDYDLPRSPSSRPQTHSPNRPTPNQGNLKPTAECCSCQLQPKPTRPNTLSTNQPKCCHCQPRKNSPEQMNQYNWNSSSPQPQYENYNENRGGYGNEYHAFPTRIDPYGANYLQNHPGRRVPCPYQPDVNDNTGCNNNERAHQDDQGWNEAYSSPGRRNWPTKDQSANYNGPKKYCVFYMTKGKSEKGNEVEVLVEELTERCKTNSKDSKMTSLKEKMKKMDDHCPMESMALRFQKGVSDSSKNFSPETGRILYF